MKPIQFAVIGCGMLARQTHLPNLARIPDARLHTCCDINDDNLASCATLNPVTLTNDYRTAIENPEVDAVIIATTETFRLPVIEAAARAGKPVYSEKPLADTLENAFAIQRVVEQHNLPFCVGHNRRCSPAMQEAREIFRSHLQEPVSPPWRFERAGWEQMEVGSNPGAPVISIRINDDWKSWKNVHLQTELNRKVGLVLSEGTHFVDLANWFLEAKPVEVLCTGQGVLNHVIVIHYDDGSMAVITMASTGSFGYPKELLEAIGHGAVVVCDHMLEVRTSGISSAPGVKRYPVLNDRHPHIGQNLGLDGWLKKKHAACQDAERNQDPMLQFTAEPDKGHLHMLSEFVREIRGERSPVCSAKDAVLAMQICLAAAKSYTEGRRVRLPEINSPI